MSDERDGSRSRQVEAAEALASRLDRPMGLLGVVFLFVVLGQLLTSDPGWARVLSITGWVLWALFAAELPDVTVTVMPRRFALAEIGTMAAEAADGGAPLHLALERLAEAGGEARRFALVESHEVLS